MRRLMSLLFCGLMTVPSMAVDLGRVGFVNADRVMRESAPALRVQKKIEKEFERRDQELQRVAKQLRQDLRQCGIHKQLATCHTPRPQRHQRATG